MIKDIYIFDTLNGGSLTSDLEMRDGLESAVYLSLFGGNAKDDGSQDTPYQWWGNIAENVPSRKYRSETAFLLSTVPPTPNNLRRIEDAALRDLDWFLGEGYASKIDALATMPRLNTVNVSVSIDGLSPLEFSTSWGAPDIGRVPDTVPPPAVTKNGPYVLQGFGEPFATLVLSRQWGPPQEVAINGDGEWVFEVYPLPPGEIAEIYVRTPLGDKSVAVQVVGMYKLTYDGSWKYDGSQTYDGVKNV